MSNMSAGNDYRLDRKIRWGAVTADIDLSFGELHNHLPVSPKRVRRRL
jgi:hypothetical protein